MRNDVSFFCEFCLTFATAGADSSRANKEPTNTHFPRGHFCTKCTQRSFRLWQSSGQLQIHFQSRINRGCCDCIALLVLFLVASNFLPKKQLFQPFLPSWSLAVFLCVIGEMTLETGTSSCDT